LHTEGTCEGDVACMATLAISGKVRSTSEFDNIIAALEHNDCICEITLYDLSIPQVENLLP
jgi:hypothetical protein